MRRPFRRYEPPGRGDVGRPIGAGVVEGAVRGAVSGIVPGLLLGGLLGATARPNAGALAMAATAVLALAAAGAPLAVSATVAPRLGGVGWQRATRFLGGLFTPVLAVMPVLAVFASPLGASTAKGSLLLVLGAIGSGVALGAGEVVAGPAVERNRAGRRAVGLLVAGTIVGLALVPFAGCGAIPAGLLLTFVYGGGFTFLLGAGERLLGARAGRRVEAWLEPDWVELDPARARARLDDLLRASVQAWRRSAFTSGPEATKALVEQALEHAWNAVALAREHDSPARARGEAVLWLVGLLVELARWDEAHLARRRPLLGGAPPGVRRRGERRVTDPARPLGPAFVVGAVRGLVAGAVPAVALLAAASFMSWIPAGAELWTLAALVGGAGLASAAVSAGDAVSRRTAAARRVRFAAGLVAPLLAGLPFLALPASFAFVGRAGPFAPGQDTAAAVLGLTCAGVALGIACAVSPPPEPGAGFGAGLWTAAGRAFFASSAFAAVSVPVGRGEWGCACVGVGLILELVALALALGHVAASPVARRVAAWLEPERFAHAFGQASVLHARADLDAHELRRWAGASADPGTARRHREAALDAARAAFDMTAHDPALARWRSSDGLRVVELLLELGRLDAIEPVLRELPEREPILAELDRVRGDAAGAIARARAAAGDPSRRVSAGARAVLVRALADRGDLVAAREELATVLALYATELPLLERLSGRELEAHLRARGP